MKTAEHYAYLPPPADELAFEEYTRPASAPNTSSQLTCDMHTQSELLPSQGVRALQSIFSTKECETPAIPLRPAVG